MFLTYLNLSSNILKKVFFYGRTFTFVPLQKVTLTNVRDGSHFFTRDWKTNLSTHTGILNQLSLIYRCIILRSSNEELKSQNLEYFLNLHIDELNTSVRDFLKNTTLDFLEGIKVGELTRKILCFFKARLLTDSLDLKNYIDSKFFYDVYYVPSRQVLRPFEEEAVISFLGVRFRAYLFSEASKKYLYIELKNTNKVYWFYCYSIAQRVFGIISQNTLDERLLETRDFVLPLVSKDHTYLLNSIATLKFDPVFYKKMGNVFRQTSDYSEANLPIVIQESRFNKYLSNKTEMLNTSNIHTSDFAVFVGNIKLYKLPFGNLIYQNYLNPDDVNLKGILIDDIDMGFIIKNNLLEPYLKTKLNVTIDINPVLDTMPQVLKNISNATGKSHKYKDLSNIFDLNILSFKNSFVYEVPERVISKSVFKLHEEEPNLSSMSEDLIKMALNKSNNLFLKKRRSNTKC